MDALREIAPHLPGARDDTGASTITEDAVKVSSSAAESSSVMHVGDDVLLKLFDTYDKDGDGFLNLDEVHCMLKHITLDSGGFFVSRVDIKEILDARDVNGDGMIDAEEFPDFLRHICSHDPTIHSSVMELSLIHI